MESLIYEMTVAEVSRANRTNTIFANRSCQHILKTSTDLAEGGLLHGVSFVAVSRNGKLLGDNILKLQLTL
ncbi:hypothetical protein E6O75_ATG00158 [Venturia nashicola]|uniref:Uncharacterized protein n=1 Tax=Venturia nashicola TaxID=86259 RepID=A0A4Z1PCZ5_9PEZI|nr:hypothetical protein E6O75_ATG00158 [Venturia nashicola]